MTFIRNAKDRVLSTSVQARGNNNKDMHKVLLCVVVVFLQVCHLPPS